MDGCGIRPGRRRDLPGMFAIQEEVLGGWSKRALEEEFETSQSRVWVATAKNAPGVCDIYGFAIAWWVGPEAQLQNIAVAKQFWRQGIAMALLDVVLLAAYRAQCREICLEVREDNQAAQALYLQRGFVSVGRRSGYYADGNVDAILMRAPL